MTPDPSPACELSARAQVWPGLALRPGAQRPQEAAWTNLFSSCCQPRSSRLLSGEMRDNDISGSWRGSRGLRLPTATATSPRPAVAPRPPLLPSCGSRVRLCLRPARVPLAVCTPREGSRAPSLAEGPGEGTRASAPPSGSDSSTLANSILWGNPEFQTEKLRLRGLIGWPARGPLCPAGFGLSPERRGSPNPSAVAPRAGHSVPSCLPHVGVKHPFPPGHRAGVVRGEPSAVSSLGMWPQSGSTGRGQSLRAGGGGEVKEGIMGEADILKTHVVSRRVSVGPARGQDLGASAA